LTRGRAGTKKSSARPKPARRRSASKSTASRTAKASAPKKRPAASKKPATKSTTASKTARKAPAKPAAKKSPPPRKPAPAKKTPAAKAPAAKSPARAAAKSPARAPAVGIVPPAAKPPARVEAPSKFRREYRKWLERLIALRHRLVQEGARLGEEGLKALEQEVSVDHMADFGSDSYEQDTTLSLIENKSEAVRDVDEAIKRIELKTYGLCEECEQLIPSGRLEVLPHARYCVHCQAKREVEV